MGGAGGRPITEDAHDRNLGTRLLAVPIAAFMKLVAGWNTMSGINSMPQRAAAQIEELVARICPCDRQ